MFETNSKEAIIHSTNKARTIFEEKIQEAEKQSLKKEDKRTKLMNKNAEK